MAMNEDIEEIVGPLDMECVVVCERWTCNNCGTDWILHPIPKDVAWAFRWPESGTDVVGAFVHGGLLRRDAPCPHCNKDAD